jgi:hypothetical protein
MMRKITMGMRKGMLRRLVGHQIPNTTIGIRPEKGKSKERQRLHQVWSDYCQGIEVKAMRRMQLTMMTLKKLTWDMEG